MLYNFCNEATVIASISSLQTICDPQHYSIGKYRHGVIAGTSNVWASADTGSPRTSIMDITGHQRDASLRIVQNLFKDDKI